VELAIQRAGIRKLVLAGSIFFSAVVILESGKVWVADRRTGSLDPDEVARGAALLPQNGEAWDRLGHLVQWDLAHPNVSAAIQDYRQALQRDPLSAAFWMDLAGGYEQIGDTAEAREAFEHAKRVYPDSAEVAWNYGSFLLRQRDNPNAYAEINRAVSIDPSLLPLAISRSWRSGIGVDQLLDKALPQNSNAYLQALDFFSSAREPDAGLAVWKRLTVLKQRIAIQRTFSFFDELVGEDRSEDVQRIWPQALAAAGLPFESPTNNSLVWNGDLARDFSNGGLDWRWDPIPDVAIDFDSAPPGTPGRSVRLDFQGGTNLELHAPAQYVPVLPNESYQFETQMRTEGITTESGLHFSIIDPNHPGRLNAQTIDLTGSHSWARMETTFKTGADTHFVLVRLLRNPSRLFENRLAGTVWFADVRLTPTKKGAPTPAP